MQIRVLGNKNAFENPAYGRVVLNSTKDTDVVMTASGQKTISIGRGDPKEMNRRKIILLARQIIFLAKANKIKKLAIDLRDFGFAKIRLAERELAELLAVNFAMANFDFIKYKTPPKEGWNFIEEIMVFGKNIAATRAGFERGLTIAAEVNSCRILANTPGGAMTPKLLAQEATAAVKGMPVKITVLDKKEMKTLGMGGILGVAQGSVEAPQFIIMEYRRGLKKEKPTVLVGKGITFDTGGLNLKPEQGINEMHMDMSGGAAVIHTVALAAKLKLKKNLVGLVPAAENMPSGSSYRPGDILTSMSGQTIEIGNTDAEGRVVLADALTYAERYKPELVIDVATLTGAAVVALGQRASAIFSRDDQYRRRFQQAGEAVGDYVWPLPLWEEFDDDIKGTFGDWSNTGKTRWGGAITAAAFLGQFARNYPWVHIDIAPRMTTIEGEYLAKGAAGAAVQLLIKFLTTSR